MSRIVCPILATLRRLCGGRMRSGLLPARRVSTIGSLSTAGHSIRSMKRTCNQYPVRSITGLGTWLSILRPLYRHRCGTRQSHPRWRQPPLAQICVLRGVRAHWRTGQTRSLLKVANSEAAGAAGMLIFQTRFYTASLLRDSCTYLIHQDESRLSVFQNILGTCRLLVGLPQKTCTESSSKQNNPIVVSLGP